MIKQVQGLKEERAFLGHDMKSIAIAGLVMVAAVSVAIAAPQTFPSSAGPLIVETFATGLVRPWALAFLPDQRLLVTERPGRMRIVTRDGRLSAPLSRLLKIYPHDQVALADVVIDRDFSVN